MGLIDTHTHFESFARCGGLLAMLHRAREAGLEAMVTVGTNVDDWTLYRDLAAAYPDSVYFTVGLHPCSVDEGWRERFAGLEAFWRGAVRPVALGEIGLDRFHLPKDNPAAAGKVFGWQKDAFAAGLDLARGLECPVVVHSRSSFSECVEMIDASGVAWERVVFHCFTEGVEQISKLMARGGLGSFTGVVTYKSAENVREAARVQGLEKMMLETDAPYLAPVPHRGKPNEPAFLRHTAEFCAQMFSVELTQLVEITARNARRFYRL